MAIENPKRKADILETGSQKKKREVLDVFTRHFCQSLDQSSCDQMKLPKKNRVIKKHTFKGLGDITEYSGIQPMPLIEQKISPLELAWNEKLVGNYNNVLEDEDAAEMDDLFNVISRYMDLQTIPRNKGYRTTYIAHIINHLIRTRNLIIGNNHKLAKANESGEVTDELIENVRDQGFARPTVLILCPFKKDAFDIVERLKSLVFGKEEKSDVWNKSRFQKEFQSGETPEFQSNLADEFKELLSGNNDDCFRIGIALSKKTLKLFEPFEKADILLCSPLGLRMILGGDLGNESHLIASIQITVIDGADVMLQQNWEHLILLFSHLHSQPTKIETDISRVRQCYLDGQAKFFSQLLLFSRYSHELFSALMFEHSLNYHGLLVQQPKPCGTLDMIELPLCQELHRFDINSPGEHSSLRFKYFTQNMMSFLLPHTCIVIPSYFDFVRIRNYFKKHEESFVACHEYAPPNKITRARDLFYHSKKSLLLVTERYHYFNRRRLKGIQQLIFYQLPNHPDFYAEFINMGSPDNSMRLKSTLLYSKYDRIRLENTFGVEMTKGILASENKIQAIVSE